MKRLLTIFLILFPLCGFSQTITHTWKTTAVNSNWNNTANWQEGSVPSGSSNVQIMGSNFQPVLSNSLTINYLLLDGGGLNIGSYTLTVSNSIKAYSAQLSSNGGKIVSPLVNVWVGTTTTGNLTMELDAGIMQGNNTFQNNFALRINSPAGSSFLLAAYNPDTYKGTVSIVNEGQGGLLLSAYADAGATPTTFEQSFSYTNNANSPNYLAENTYSGSRLLFKGPASFTDNSLDPNAFMRIWKSEFEQSVSVYSKASIIIFSGDILLKNQLNLSADGGFIGFGVSNVVITSTGNIQVGSGGFGSGSILFGGLQCQSNGTINLLLGDANTHSSVLTSIQTTSQTNFVGAVNFRADYIELNGSTFNGNASFERTGPNRAMSMIWNGNGNNRGGNVFNGSVTVLNNSGTNWNWATLIPDVFNGNATFKHGRGASSQLNIAQSGAHIFQENVVLQSTSDALATGGVQIGNASDTTKLAVGKLIGTAGFLGGRLQLKRFLQMGSSTPQFIAMPPAASLQFDQVVFNGTLTATAGHLTIANSKFLRTSQFTKTATGTDISNGSNFFYRYTSFTNNAPAGNYIQFIAPNDVLR